MKEIIRGSIFYTNLDPITDSEQQRFRPVVILQNNTSSQYSPTIIIAPITTKEYKGKYFPTHVKVTTLNKLRPNSIILLEQIRTIDKNRLKGYVTMLSEKEIQNINNALIIALNIGEIY